jgi:tRNA-dihydrouridine synthase 4
MVTSAKSALQSLSYTNKTVSVKIRIHKDLRDTVDFIKAVEEAGVDFITIHGRTRSTPSSKPVDLDAIKLLAEHTTVPTLSNGDVYNLSHAYSDFQQTGVDGVMSARGILQNPALFAGYETCPWEAVEIFMTKVMRAPIPYKLVVHHLSEMIGSDYSMKGLGTLVTKEQRMEMMSCSSMVDLIDWLDDLRIVRRY